MTQNVIVVPQRCPILEKAMALAKVFSERKEYMGKDPPKIRLDEGVHAIVGVNKRLIVTCSHITFVGKGKAQSTIRGGFSVTNEQHVKFEELAVMNPSGHGFYLEGMMTNVVLKCIVKEEGLGCGCKIVPLLQQRNVNLWETVKAGCIVMVQLQKIRLNDCTMHFVLSWIFMGQKNSHPFQQALWYSCSISW